MFFYFLVVIAVIFLGFKILFCGEYQKGFGNSFSSTLFFAFSTNVFGSICLFVLNGFTLSVTWFTFIVALLSAVNTILYFVFSLKALSVLNLSLYSVFLMIGGMLLPFLVGIIFYNEPLTIAKIICVILIIISIVITLDRKNKADLKSLLYGAGIFLINGMSAVYCMCYSNSHFPKNGSADYTLLTSLLVLVLSGSIFLIRKDRINFKSGFSLIIILSIVLCGILSIVGDYFLLIALKHIPGSLQFPMVTGGVMIISTVFGYFSNNKPTKKDVLSVIVAFSAMLALLLPL